MAFQQTKRIGIQPKQKKWSQPVPTMAEET